MREVILGFLKSRTQKRVRTKDLEAAVCDHVGTDAYWKQGGYLCLAQEIGSLVQEGVLRPIKAWKWNGMNPPLYNGYQYQEMRVKPDPSWIGRILTQYHPQIRVSAYLRDPEVFAQDKPYLEALDTYLKGPRGGSLTVNERSFQVFGDEKWLAGPGQGFLQKVGLRLTDLDCHATYEPFFYFQQQQEVRGILIIENRDTFYTLKALLARGISCWDGLWIDLLIYGEGRKILSSIAFLEEICPGCRGRIFYFGDLDLEGIRIWYELTLQRAGVEPMVVFYQRLLELHGERAPRLRSRQRWHSEAIEAFMQFFPRHKRELEALLPEKYIPQEGLHAGVFEVLAREERVHGRDL